MNDLNVDNKKLIDAMKMMRENPTEIVKNEFLEQVFAANFIVPATITPEPVDGKILEDSKISFFFLQNKEKKNYILTFSAPEQYLFWKEHRRDTSKKVTVLNYGYDQLAKIVMDYPTLFGGFLIDPNGYNFAIESDLIRDIDKAKNPEVAVEPVRILPKEGMGLEPADPKGLEPLLEAISKYLDTENSVRAAYLMKTVRRGDTLPTLIVVVDFVGGRMKYLFDGIATVARDTVDNCESLGLMPASDKIAGHAIENVEPFYKKKK